MASIQLNEVSRRFGNSVAVEGITLDIPDGAFWVLVGPSGCGKSTILRSIAGLETPTSGEIYIDEVLVNQVPARQRDVAMVFQNYALYPHMTVAENLAFGLRMRAKGTANREDSERAIAERVEAVAQSLDITHLLQRKPRQLSGGQQQRVALGRAIARKPKAFLLDEPLSNLDAQLRDDTRAELKQLHQRLGITTVYVTHDQIEAMTLADRIVVLCSGRIQQIADPQTIYAKPANRRVATFMGVPPMNIFPATCDRDRLYLHGAAPEESLPYPPHLAPALQRYTGRTVDIGIRPEHVRVLTDCVVSSGDETPGAITFIVQVVEPLGKETLIRAVLPEGDRPANLLIPATCSLATGDRLSVLFPAEHLYAFDPSSGMALIPTS